MSYGEAFEEQIRMLTGSGIAISGAGEMRYIAGFGVVNDEVSISVHVVIESEPGESMTRLGQPITLIPSMTKEQAEHLHMQLGKAIGFRDEAPPQ